MTGSTGMIDIASFDGKSFSAYIAMPDAEIRCPAVVVIQEIFGVNAGMREICDNLAAAGFVAVCPDLFWRQQPGVQLTDKTEDEWKKALALMEGFDTELGIKDIQSTIDAMRTDDAVNGKVGAMGYCLGGKLAYLTAAKTDVDCSVSYYGVGIQDMLELMDDVTKPLMLHIAALDSYVPPEAQEKIIAAAEDHNMVVQAFLYEGVDHAFARPRGVNYNNAAAKAANMRSADFLARNLLDAETLKELL